MAVSREFIPDAAEGSAPNLDIKRRIGRSVPSEGGESAHSLALSSLSRMRLDSEGIPIARKIADKQFKYFDTDGNPMPKEKAMQKAGGVVYYQDSSNPTKGRLRHRGSFVSADDARTIVSGSRASKCSDIANLRDLEGFEALPIVAENLEETDQQKAGAEDHVQDIKTGRGFLVHLTWVVLLFMLVLLVFGASTVSTQLVVGDAKVLQSLDPVLTRLLSKHETSKCSEHDGGCEGTSVTGYFLDAPSRAIFGEASVESRKTLATAEVERILATRKVSEILGDGTNAERQQVFMRIVRLLHPDKGLVSPHDVRAALALRLVFAARRTSSD